jgi:hypothetical protein
MKKKNNYTTPKTAVSSPKIRTSLLAGSTPDNTSIHSNDFENGAKPRTAKTID